MATPLTDPVTLDLLWQYGQLCDICEQCVWTERAQWHRALVCEECAENEPSPDDEEEPR
jgi:hypothetical protein